MGIATPKFLSVFPLESFPLTVRSGLLKVAMPVVILKAYPDEHLSNSLPRFESVNCARSTTMHMPRCPVM